MHQFLPGTPDEAFQEANPLPQEFATLEDMWEWHRPLIEAEHQNSKPLEQICSVFI